MSEGDPRRPFRRPGDVPERESRVLTYGVPFTAALLIAIGITGVVIGGWAIVQPAVGGCGSPLITVLSPEETAERYGDDPTVPRLDFEELTTAEQRAFEEAAGHPRGEATVDGDFDHREVFDRGVLVTYEGTDRYATVLSMNECLSVSPLAFPLGAITLLIGLGGFAYLWYRFESHKPPFLVRE